MKATKIFFSILGVALASISFGQLTEYNEDSGRVTQWVSHLPDRNLRDVAHKQYKPSIVSRAYFANEIEVTYESVPVIEAWMTVPFEDGLMEPDMHIESWMSTPFESKLDEKELKIESWMTSPWI